VSPEETNFIMKMREDVQFFRERHDFLTMEGQNKSDKKLVTNLSKSWNDKCSVLGEE
jgi:hypothetical protein